MKTVPKYIKNEMRLVSKYAMLADEHMKNVENWLERAGIDTNYGNGFRDGDSLGLEELEYGCDIVDELCEKIESFLNRTGERKDDE